MQNAFIEGAVAAEEKSAASRSTRSEIKSKARSSIDLYSEKEYNDFGWARANDVLTADEYENFTAEFAKARTSNAYSDYLTPSGEYMIAVGKMYGVKEGVKNKIVFAKGTIAHPIITRIVEIDADNETFLSEKRSEIYEAERQGLRTKTSSIFTLYDSFDFRNKQREQQRSSIENVRHNNQLGTDGGTGSGAAQGAEAAVPENLGHYPVVETFKDANGKSRKVRRLGKQFMVEGTKKRNYLYPTAQEAIDAENAYLEAKKVRHKSRAPVSAPYASPTAQNVVTNIKQAYKPTFSDKTLTSRLATQIALTNEQAGIEAVAFRQNRIKTTEALFKAVSL